MINYLTIYFKTFELFFYHCFLLKMLHTISYTEFTLKVSFILFFPICAYFLFSYNCTRVRVVWVTVNIENKIKINRKHINSNDLNEESSRDKEVLYGLYRREQLSWNEWVYSLKKKKNLEGILFSLNFHVSW